MIGRFLNGVRNALWNYPVAFGKFYTKTKPVSAIVLFALVGVYTFQLLSSPTLYDMKLIASEQERFTEGIVGKVGTYNPMFVSGSDVDRSVYSLLYTQLISIENDEPVPDLATEWLMLNDGKSVRVKIRDDMYWHDGEKVTADDVVYTIQKSINLGSKGLDTFGASLSGLTVNADSDYSITFTFEENVASMLESLAMPILPEHVLSTIPDDQMYNYGRIELPVGSGLYKAELVEDGRLQMRAWEQHPNTPKIKRMTLLFFDDIADMKIAFRNNVLDAVGNIDPDAFEMLSEYKKFKTYTIDIPQRKKILFFNLRNPKISEDQVRRGLAYSLDRQSIADSYSMAYRKTNSTIPSDSWAYSDVMMQYTFNEEEADKAFEAAGYKYDSKSETLKNDNGEELEINLTYLDSDQNRRLSEEIFDMWEEMGVKVVKYPVTYDSLVNEVFATRNFEVMLMELEVTSDPDQYNIWHSTKTNYPDMNISGYEYDRIDVLLERSRNETDQATRKEDYTSVQKALGLDVPVIPLYEPSYTYIIKSDIENLYLEETEFPFQRYWNIENWEVE